MPPKYFFLIFAAIFQYCQSNEQCGWTKQQRCIRPEIRFRWDERSSTCERFTGCPGEGNNYESYTGCLQTCANPTGFNELSGVEIKNYYDVFETDSIPLPFIQEIGSKQLIDGKAISIKGEVKGDQFHFDLADGPNQSGSVTSNYAIDVSCRLSEGWVINTRINNVWQTEDRYPLGKDIGKYREIYVRIEPYRDFFAIFANGQKIGERKYDIPLEQVSYVYVSGKLNLHKIQFEDNFYMVPFIYDFKSFNVGRDLYLTARPDRDSRQFFISLRADDDNIPLQFNPRFTVEVRWRSKTVVRNTMMDGKWQHEDREGKFPFVKGEVFDLIIETGDDAYKIYVNGQEFCTYYHRLPVSSVKTLEIGGDVEITTIH